MNKFKYIFGFITAMITCKKAENDTLIMSETFKQHLRDFKLVFDRLNLFEHRINRDKSVFVSSKLKYWDTLYNEMEIHVDLDKISEMLDRQPPRNLKQALFIAETCSWYRKFSPRFTEIARPLTEHTKVKVEMENVNRKHSLS